MQVLELNEVNCFYGKAHVLNSLDLTVEHSQIVSLLGRNGAGKTTTMKAIMQMVPPKTGRVQFLGEDITGFAPHKVAKMGLGYVPEDRRIFTDLTVLENLEVGRQRTREGAVTWTLDMLFDLFPNLAERRHNRGRELSGGEQQMLTIARTLMGNPRLILLDEPSEGIAPLLVEQMARIILLLKKEGLTVLISEQNLHFAQIVADAAVIIESGTEKYSGTFEDLNAHPEIRDAYLTV